MKFVKFLLGTDQTSIVIGATVWSLALGNMIVFHAIIFGIRPSQPLWQAIATGVAIGLFLMPFLFMSVARALPYTSPWAALATMAAAFACPLLMSGLAASGDHRFIMAAGSIGFIVAAFFAGRAVDKWCR